MKKSEIRTPFLSLFCGIYGGDVSPPPPPPPEFVTAGGLVVGFNGGKYAIPSTLNNMSLWKDRAEECLWWLGKEKVEVIMTYKSKVISFKAGPDPPPPPPLRNHHLYLCRYIILTGNS